MIGFPISVGNDLYFDSKAIFGFKGQMFISHVTRALQFFHRSFISRSILEQTDFPEFFPQKVLMRISQQITHERIGIDDVTGRIIQKQNAVLCGLKQSPIANFGNLQCRLGLFDIVDIRVRPHPHHDCPGMISHGQSTTEMPAVNTIKAAEATFKLEDFSRLN